MRRLKKVMLATSVISGIGLTAAGAAQAVACDDQAPRPAVENAQSLDCEQEFTASLVTVNAPVTVLGESVTNTNIGNFCTQVGHGQ
ncbi:hypothetical protein [Streptomyces sp. NPDC014006]|uniref:hypothetical protein n=1 Tax=Streptomyces sp. NPDC014006 TaxID=3364870 RepID=UPI0036FE36F9